MSSLNDQQLLQDYAARQSEAAFTELVRRHIDLVYSAALRMVCDSHLAQDVTQGVFVALAKNAGHPAERPVLSGWLHRTAQNIASNTVRSEVRRRAREQEAVTMNQLNETDATWEIIAPQLDTALEELPETDRDALLLRYFEHKTVREMAGILGTSEDAAQKRVNRAEEKLREHFTKKHLVVSSGTLVVLISANAVKAAPIGLSLTISATIIKTGVGLGIGTKILAAAKIGSVLGSAATFLPVLGNFYFIYKAKLEDARSHRERRLMFRFLLIQVICTAVLVCLFVEFFIGSSFAVTREILLFIAIILCGSSFVFLFKKYEKELQRIQMEEGTWVEPQPWKTPSQESPLRKLQYSKRNMYGHLATICGMLSFIAIESRNVYKGSGAALASVIASSVFVIVGLIQAWRNRPR